MNSKESKLHFKGCRAWEFSNSGFAGVSNGYVEWANCWAFDGGQLYGEGCGWKYSFAFSKVISRLPVARVLKNCISVLNGAYVFSPNNQGYENMTVLCYICYNNTAFYNGYKHHPGVEFAGEPLGFGFRITQPNPSNSPKGEMYANNLAYKNEIADIIIIRNYPLKHQYYSWSIPLAITDDDFISLDWTEMKRTRKKDGSLPSIDFMKPKNEAQLIDKGVDEGLPFLGKAPDLGAFERR